MDIFIDWGSTNFRAFLTDGGAIADSLNIPGRGIFQFQEEAHDPERFGRFIAQELGDWLTRYPDATIVMCGTIGSRDGWMDTGYVEVPAGLKELTGKLHPLSPKQDSLIGRRIFIVPGCAIRHADGRHDVMRSEETKALGAAAYLRLKDGLFCVPGTHCKWVHVENTKITSFISLMTGELYGLLTTNGSLATLLSGQPEGTEENCLAAFDQGLEQAREGYDLLADIWQVRSRALRDENPPGDLSSFLSGILVGHELLQAVKSFPPGDIVLLADPGRRREFYARALRHYGWNIQAQVPSDLAAITGMAALL